MKSFGGGLRSTLLLALGTLFFLLATGLTLLSSGVYRDIAAASDANFTHRTALSYLVNQVRRSDVAGGIAIGSFGGSDALLLRESGYVTILYCYEGQLRELYMEQGLGLAPADGMPVLPLDRLSLTQTDALLTITVTDQTGQTRSTALSPRCGIETEAAG